MSKSEPIEPVAALRETVEAVMVVQKAMGDDVADMAQAVTELTKTAEALANALSDIKELTNSVAQLGEMMHAYTAKMGELHDQQVETSAQIGRYIQDAAKQQSGIRDVDRRLRAIEGGAARGER